MRLEKCGSCRSSDLRQFLDLGSTPLADDFPEAPESVAPSQHWPLGAAECGACGLVQLTEVVPDDVLWRGDYGFYTGASPSSITYFQDYADSVIAAYPFHTRDFVVELACNDGTLLQHFRNVASRALGVEPATGPADAARALKGLDIDGRPFGGKVAASIVNDFGPASLVIANNVIAHVADLDDFVCGLSLLLAADGLAYLEFQYLPDLLLGNGIDLFYHEHRSFFTLTSLANVLRRHDLAIHGATWTPAQGGSQRVTVGHSRGMTVAFPGEVDTGALLAGLQGRADMVRDRLRRLVNAERAAGRSVVGYGAPAKATTLLHWCGLTSPEDLPVVYDATPAKSGRYMPGTDIPIVLAPTLGDMDDAQRVTALMLPHNYLRGILARERAFMAAGGRFLVPLPVPVVL